MKELFEAALERGVEARAAFLNEACAGDESLREEVERLIRLYEQDKSFMESPAVAGAARSLVADQTESLISTSLGPYRIIRQLGRGGMGEVYLAEDSRLGRQVALKLLPAIFTTDRLSRFQQEARLASSLSHPNICVIYEVGKTEDGRHYIAMEYVGGVTLRQHMRETRMGLDEVFDIAMQAAAALTAAHTAGIVHRDIKPENIMLRQDRYIKVLDFGLAKLTQQPRAADSDVVTRGQVKTESGVLMGTVTYMSPEQARGLPVDGRTDIWSLGVVLYEMVAGTVPFKGATNSDVIVSILEREPQSLAEISPGVPDDLERIVKQALSKDREVRYQTAEDLAVDLRDLKPRLELLAPLSSFSGRQEVANTDGSRVQEITAGRRVQVVTWINSALATLSETVRRPRASIFTVLLICAAAFLVALVVFKRSGTTPHRPPPGDASWFFFDRGTAALRDGAYFQASKAFERAIQIDDNYALAHARLGEAWSELDCTDKAKNELLRANALVPDRSALEPLDALYLQGVTDTISRNFGGAVESYQKICEQIPDKDKKYAYVDLGRAYEKNEEIDKAIASYEQAAKLDSDYATAFLRLGVLFGRRQLLSKADEAFTKAESQYQTLSNLEGVTEVLFERGLLLNTLDHLTEARLQLGKAIEVARANNSIYQQVRAQLQLASVLAAEGDTVKAEQSARDVIEVARANGLEELTTRGLIETGYAFFIRGEYGDAETYFSQALELGERFAQPPNAASARLALGSLRTQQLKPDEGIAYLRHALDFFQPAGYAKETAIAHLLLGRAYRQKGDYEAALQVFRHQLEVAQNVGDRSQIASFHGEIGTVQFHQEQYTEALNNFDQSYQVKKSLNALAVLSYDIAHRAEALWRLGRYAEARKALDEATPKSVPSRDRQFLAFVHQIRAQMALSELNFRDTKLEAQKSLETAKAFYPPIAISARCALGLARSRSGSLREGQLLCEEAAGQAKALGDPALISETLLALAETMIESGNTEQGLENALRAQEHFARLGQRESEWRAWLIAARASRNLDDRSDASKYASYASAGLSKLEQQWESPAYSGYVARPDIKRLRGQLSQVLAFSGK
ncbi:MAG TPA: protein kinase [Blastocatellia bacterium]|nr:protein kinase [Blastocatellia bacterium]